MRAVNLLPRDSVAQGRKAPPLPLLVACVGSVLVTAVLAVMYGRGTFETPEFVYAEF